MSSYRPLTSYAPVTPAATPHGPPHGTSGIAPVAPAQFQLAELLRLIEARRGLILKVTLATILAAVIVALMLPVSWSSSALVMLDTRKNNIADMSAVLSQLPSDPAGVQNQIEILTSRSLAEKVIRDLQLYDDPEFNPALNQSGIGAMLNPRKWFAADAPPDVARQHDAILDAFAKHITAEAAGLSTGITVTARANDPAKAARIANMMVNDYVGDQMNNRSDVAQNTVDWLGMRVNNLAGLLQQQDADIQRYKAQHGLNESGPGNSLVDQSMAGINAGIVQARSDVAEKQATYDRVQSLAQSGNAGELSQVAASPVIVQLRSQQADLIKQQADLATKYGPLHPKMQALQAQRRDLEQKIAIEVTRASGAVGNDLAVAKAHLASLEASLGGAEREARTQNMARVELAAMQSNAASTRTQYEAFVQRLRQAQDQDAGLTPESRVISAATIPLSPSGPKRSMIVAASLPLGMLLGLLAALLAEKIGQAAPLRVNGVPRAALMAPAKIKAPAKSNVKMKKAQAQKPLTLWTGPPVLAQVPGAGSLRAADYVIDWPDSRFTLGINALVRQLESHGEGAAIVAVTSASPGESKSAIAVSLARAAAKMGRRTVLVDCDPARLASKAVGATVKAGLYDVLTGEIALNEALVKDPRGELFLLGMPRRPRNTATMFASQAMIKLIEVLRAGAELVVLDCGPAAQSPDAALIARHGDATVLVTRQSGLHTPQTAKAADILKSAEAAPVGIVVVS